jgi:hypothetical protein
MIRFIDPGDEIRPEELVNKYLWLRPTGKVERWTANEYPIFITEAVYGAYGRPGEFSYFNGLKEKPVWNNEERRYVLTGDRIGALEERYTDMYLRQSHCICDTPEEVNAIRAMGSQVRMALDVFWARVVADFRGLTEQNLNPPVPRM